ncbi:MULTISPECIES: hypothetical protein [unclassified Rhodococcus (in: high G+C Gram-positive bacteria)]|uniref:hypothetical protein n=1 Tax=unclassified Rhodococcus (in: high G+C Gram-positive bacteria) TaxID=192944 RepID=UPI00117B929D|nr:MULTISPECIES: hypothetical protein [unclassified Rhodococcus (in: high G+C Gram-positive bacteria)]
MPTVNLASRRWDHVVPVALGDVSIEGVRLVLQDQTPDLWLDPTIDGGEASLSRYIRARALGDHSITALPIFLMTGFRHRCIITSKSSRLESASELRNGRIGLTGWADTGNVWTRAIVRSDGVDMSEAEWTLGRLTADHPIFDRTGGVALPANVTHSIDDESLMSQLARGKLDAVMTPFMPGGFFSRSSQFRTLYRDVDDEEANYYAGTGFVPGIHVLGIKTEILDSRPGFAQQLVNLFERAKLLSFERRHKLQDVLPLQNQAIARSVQTFGEDWMPYGISRSRTMIDALQRELVAQQLMPEPLDISELFPYALDPELQSSNLEGQ